MPDERLTLSTAPAIPPKARPIRPPPNRDDRSSAGDFDRLCKVWKVCDALCDALCIGQSDV